MVEFPGGINLDNDPLAGTYVPGYGDPEAKLAIFGEAPGVDEARHQPPMPFMGKTGQMLAEALWEAGMHINDTYRSNIVKVKPPFNNIKLLHTIGTSIQAQMEQVEQELEFLKNNGVNCILALGAIAFENLTGKKGVMTWRGSILQTKNGIKIVSTIHPARLFKHKGEKRGALPWQYWHVIKHDIARAVEESQLGPEYKLPFRSIQICRSPAQLASFLDANKAKKKAAVDIEAIKQIPCAVGIAFSPQDCMSVSLNNVGSWRDPNVGLSDLQYAEIWKMLDRFFEDELLMLIGQNFKYDHDKLKRPCGFKIGRNRLLADTSLMAHTLNPEYPVSLAFLTSINTKQPYYKDEGHEFDYTKQPYEVFLKYNGMDGCCTYEIYDRQDADLTEMGLHDFYYNFVNKLHDFYMELEGVGFLIDEEVRWELMKKYVERFNETMDRLAKVAGRLINPNSNPQVRNLLFHELKLPERAKADDDTLSLLLANNIKREEQREAIICILEGRQIRKTLSTYLFVPPDFDGRMRCSYRIPGTETGRTATKKLEPPIRPRLLVGKGSKAKKKEVGLMFHNITKHGDIGGDVRSMYIVDPGTWFGEIDMSQVEARFVALLANAVELLEFFRTGQDVHKITASWCYSVPVDKITSVQRQVCKHVRHAGNYGMGARRLVELLAVKSKQLGVDLNISEWRANEILRIFHRYTPTIRDVFHEEVKYYLNHNNRTLVNPFGRQRQFLGHWGDELFREAFAQIPQSTVPDHLRMAAMRAKARKPSICILVESHDGMTFRSKIEEFDEDARILKEELERPIDFTNCTLSRGSIVIPAEVKVAKRNFKEFEDYHFAA